MNLAIIQARTSSTRLPRKVLLEVFEIPLIIFLLERINKSKCLNKIILATSSDPSDDHLSQIVRDKGFNVYRGSLSNVLDRYAKCAAREKFKNIIRITGDCPMIDPSVVEQVIDLFKTKKFDYVSNSLPRTFPDGLDCEIFSFKVLEYSFLNAKTEFSKEHVTAFVRGVSNEKFKKKIKTGNISFSSDFSKIRWTLDYIEDLERIRSLYKLLPENFSWLDALSVAITKPKLLGLT